MDENRDPYVPFYDPSMLCKVCGDYLEQPAHRIFRICPWCAKEENRRRFKVKSVGVRRKAGANA